MLNWTCALQSPWVPSADCRGPSYHSLYSGALCRQGPSCFSCLQLCALPARLRRLPCGSLQCWGSSPENQALVTLSSGATVFCCPLCIVEQLPQMRCSVVQLFAVGEPVSQSQKQDIWRLLTTKHLVGAQLLWNVFGGMWILTRLRFFWAGLGWDCENAVYGFRRFSIN